MADTEEYRRWLGGLKWVARRAGYQDNWAHVNFRQHFGFWPSDIGLTRVSPVPIEGPNDISAFIGERLVIYWHDQGHSVDEITSRLSALANRLWPGGVAPAPVTAESVERPLAGNVVRLDEYRAARVAA